MKIVLCDDDRNSLEQMAENVKEVAPEAEIYYYISVKDLIESRKVFDIAFLDIEMDNNNDGFKAAKYVKEKNIDCIIAFFTNYDSYATEGYNYRAYRFILKDEGTQLIRHHFSETIKEYYRVTGRISLISGVGKRIVSIKNIMYIQMKDHYADVYLSNGDKCLWRKPLYSMEPYLWGFNFERCHNSYIVNMEYVKEKVKNQFILKNGTSLKIGRTYMKAINDKYMNL